MNKQGEESAFFKPESITRMTLPEAENILSSMDNYVSSLHQQREGELPVFDVFEAQERTRVAFDLAKLINSINSSEDISQDMLDQLEEFARLVETRGFSKAAQHLRDYAVNAQQIVALLKNEDINKRFDGALMFKNFRTRINADLFFPLGFLFNGEGIVDFYNDVVEEHVVEVDGREETVLIFRGERIIDPLSPLPPAQYILRGDVYPIPGYPNGAHIIYMGTAEKLEIGIENIKKGLELKRAENELVAIVEKHLEHVSNTELAALLEQLHKHHELGHFLDDLYDSPVNQNVNSAEASAVYAPLMAIVAQLELDADLTDQERETLYKNLDTLCGLDLINYLWVKNNFFKYYRPGIPKVRYQLPMLLLIAELVSPETVNAIIDKIRQMKKDDRTADFSVLAEEIYNIIEDPTPEGHLKMDYGMITEEFKQKYADFMDKFPDKTQRGKEIARALQSLMQKLATDERYAPFANMEEWGAVNGTKVQDNVKIFKGKLLARGSIESGLIYSEASEMSLSAQDAILQNLRAAGERLEGLQKTSEQQYSNIKFSLADRPTNAQKADVQAGSVMLDISLFRQGNVNNDLIDLEVEQGVVRSTLQQISATDAMFPLLPAAIELFAAQQYVQSFIDIASRAASPQEGKDRQQAVLDLMAKMGDQYTAIAKVLQYVMDNNIKAATQTQSMLVKMITNKDEFAGIGNYPVDIQNELAKMSLLEVQGNVRHLQDLMDYNLLRDMVTQSRTSKYAQNVRAHKEQTIQRILDGNDVQLAYLKVQNFKGVFNTFGSELGIGHLLGDVGIMVISKVLKETLEARLAPYGITIDIGNAGAEYFLTFSNVGNVDINAVLNDMIVNPASDFRKAVVSETKQALRNSLSQQAYVAIESELNTGFLPANVHMYGSLSEHMRGSTSEAALTDTERINNAAQTTDNLYSQAFQLAKHQQMKFSQQYESTRARVRRALGTVTDVQLVDMFKPVVQDSAKVMESGIMPYSDRTMQEIMENSQLGLKNEYQIFHLPIAPTYEHHLSLNVMLDEYLKAIEKGYSIGQVNELRNRLLDSMLRYQSPNITTEEIYEGNEHFKRVINFLVKTQPQDNVDLTFRVGGDEYSKVVWNAQTKEVTIYRFDGNNVGATNFEWGMSIGDKLIDESLRIISETENIADLQNNVSQFFTDMGERALKLSDEDLLMLQRKAPNFHIMSVNEYEQLKGTDAYFNAVANKSAVAVQRADGFYLVKFPDIHVPYVLQKDNIRFDSSKLPASPDAEGALPITLRGEDAVVDFVMVRDEATGGVILTSTNPRAPPATAISLEQIQNGTEIFIPVEGRQPVSIVVSMEQEYGSKFILHGDIMLINEQEFEARRDNLIEKDGKPAILVTSRPVVSTGYISIDITKIPASEFNRDFASIQGRADSASDVAKESLKTYQVLNNGHVNTSLTYLGASEQFAGSTSEIESFKEMPFSGWDTMIAQFLLADPVKKLDRRLNYLLNPDIAMSAADVSMLRDYVMNYSYQMSDDTKQDIVKRLMDSYSSDVSAQARQLIRDTLSDLALDREFVGIIQSSAQLRRIIGNPILARGKVGSSLFFNSETNLSNQQKDQIRQRLLKLGEQLELRNKTTETTYKSIQFELVDNPTISQRIEVRPNTVVINVALFDDASYNEELIMMEIEAGLARVQLDKLSLQPEITNIDPGVRELFILEQYVQSFIDIGTRYPDVVVGAAQQQAVIDAFQSLGSAYSDITELLQEVKNKSVTDIADIRDVLIDRIVSATLEDSLRYPEVVRKHLSYFGFGEALDLIPSGIGPVG